MTTSFAFWGFLYALITLLLRLCLVQRNILEIAMVLFFFAPMNIRPEVFACTTDSSHIRISFHVTLYCFFSASHSGSHLLIGVFRSAFLAAYPALSPFG